MEAEDGAGGGSPASRQARMSVTNGVHDLLCRIGVCDRDSIRPLYPRVRDRTDIAVGRCEKSGVIVLSRSDHLASAFYEEQSGWEYWGVDSRQAAIASSVTDDRRRADQFMPLIAGRKWLDFGTGAGGILDLLADRAGDVAAVEPQAHARTELDAAGYRVYRSITDVPDDDFDVVTMFHVFEHLPEPMAVLERCRSVMGGGARLVIEVPHAADLLISFFDLPAFRAHTFWSEHLVLHTRTSLQRVLEYAGFENVSVTGCQRYPVANHLHWLAKGAPGGHLEWSELRTAALDQAYADMLASIDRTDTLIALAESPRHERVAAQ